MRYFANLAVAKRKQEFSRETGDKGVPHRVFLLTLMLNCLGIEGYWYHMRVACPSIKRTRADRTDKAHCSLFNMAECNQTQHKVLTVFILLGRF